MPKTNTTAVTVTILNTSHLVFGGNVDFKTSVPLQDATREVLLQVQADAGGGLAAYCLTDANGFGSCKLGPTPSWSSGAGKGTLSVVEFNPKTGTFSTEKGSTVAFNVAA